MKIYIDFDDILKKMTIYIINYNNFNYKIYDFYKWIFALKDNASDEDLYNYFFESLRFAKSKSKSHNTLLSNNFCKAFIRRDR